MFEKYEKDENISNTDIPNEWGSIANMATSKEQTEQNSSEKETNPTSAAQQHRQIWDKIIDRDQENAKRYDKIENQLHDIGLDFNDVTDNKDKLDDNLRSEYEKYLNEYDTIDSLQEHFDHINDKVSENLAEHIIDNMDDGKIKELIQLDQRHEGYDNKYLENINELLNSNEAFGLFCLNNANLPNFKGKTPKESLQILEKLKEQEKEHQKFIITSTLERVSYDKKQNDKIDEWLDRNVPDHEKIEGEALLEILDKDHNAKSEKEIFSELF